MAANLCLHADSLFFIASKLLKSIPQVCLDMPVFSFVQKIHDIFFLNFFKEREIGFNLVEQIVIKGRA